MVDGAAVAVADVVTGDLDVVVAPVLRRVAAEVDAVGAVVGPGSHTGVRAGVAAAAAVALSRGIPLFGIDALEVAAQATPLATAPAWALVVADQSGGWIAEVERDREGTPVPSLPPRRVRLPADLPHGPIVAVAPLPPAVAGRVHEGDWVACLGRVAARAVRRPLHPLHLRLPGFGDDGGWAERRV